MLPSQGSRKPRRRKAEKPKLGAAPLDEDMADEIPF